MTFLRKRFIEDMQLHGYSQRTVDAYDQKCYDDLNISPAYH